MSKPNEPPLALDSWYITVVFNDSSDFTIGIQDIPVELRTKLQFLIDEYVEIHIDHLRGKYGH